MAFIRCDGCGAVHESSVPVCPGCGRCPGCGKRRIDRNEFKKYQRCPECDVPYCSGCGRCHQCNRLRFLDTPPCDCGFPQDEEKVREIVASFGIDRPKPAGCLGAMVLLSILAVAGFCFFGIVH